MEKVKIYNTKLHKSRLLAVRLVILYSSNKNKEYNMIISVLAKTERCLLRHRLQRLVLLNGGRSNFDWCRVWGD